VARAGAEEERSSQLTSAQRSYLERGVGQPGGKLPLFATNGRQINHQTIRACIESGWAEPWFNNPIKPDWLVCRLTEAGYRVLGEIPPDIIQ
jgi:hypothetical protein